VAVWGIQVAVPARDGWEGNGRSDVSRAGEGGVIGMKGRLGAWTNQLYRHGSKMSSSKNNDGRGGGFTKRCRLS
jgi:hypothetical protein